MTTIAVKKYNRATKIYEVEERFKATYSRKHGRPRGRGRRVLKFRPIKSVPAITTESPTNGMLGRYVTVAPKDVGKDIFGGAR